MVDRSRSSGDRQLRAEIEASAVRFAAGSVGLFLARSWDAGEVIGFAGFRPLADSSRALSWRCELKSKVRRLESFGAFVEIAPGLENAPNPASCAHSPREDPKRLRSE